MRVISRISVLFILTFSLVSCKEYIGMADAIPAPAHIVIGDSYYTQFVIQYEKNRHLTTNYRRGHKIPVNTQVRLLKITAKLIEVEVDNLPKPLIIKNAIKHTGDDIHQAFDKLFAKDQVSLVEFNLLERGLITKGSVAKGMSKRAVEIAIGYPPITETPSLDDNTWTYWSGRFNKFLVKFKKGRVVLVLD
ncbi:MAG: hypothetical protein KAG19_08635 [Methylococcales bacterium]|nr:hypothetical protein [Methylococcales bacterium]